MKSWILGLLTFSFVIVGFVYLQNYFVTSYGYTDDVQLSPQYNVYNETQNIMGQSQQDLYNTSVTEGAASDSVIRGAWATIKNMGNILPITYKVLSRASIDLHLPAWMLPMLFSMILTIIIFWIIGWIAGLVTPK